ncbi:single-strand DNA endonuclease 1 [Magnolia sinica]|uniref:single-strand DNA endonuclease 1 n=1 Tax=Magnolia sinica TaxID=86752 RepID=UPI002657EE46|nr:single-strand DNA endonuclease 1 [Magnolia sinica]
MGVKNLWDILESCKKTLPLHHLQNKRFCIDLSCWIIQLQNASKTPAFLKEKVYLSGLFHRLRALISLNCSLILVTDGSIPAIKLSTYRRRLGSGNEVTRDESNLHGLSSLPRNKSSVFSTMIKEAKALGMALGIPCLNGLEEAEAQCALLNSESLCDGCFTADSDVFLFGARTVYRDLYLGESGYVVCYEMVDIEKKLGFGRNSLISLALFLGSDYSQGVHGIGQETACQIVKSIGDDLVLQQIASEGLAFAKKTRGSKKQGQILNCNTGKENCVDKQNVNDSDQNAALDHQFLQVIDAYLKPKCHSLDSTDVQSVFIPHPFQRSQLQMICAHFFGWTPEKTDEYILPKIAERDLRRFANLRNTSQELGVRIPFCKIPATCPVSAIVKQRTVQGRECFEVAWEEVDGLKTSIVPADLVESACPEKIAEFMERRAEAKQQKKRKPKPKKLAQQPQIPSLSIESDAQGAAMHHQPIGASSVKTMEKRTEAKQQKRKQKSNKSAQQPHGPFPGIELDTQDAAICHRPTGASSAETNVIDISSPLPPIRACKTAKCQETRPIELDQQLQRLLLDIESQTDDMPDAATYLGLIGPSIAEPEVVDLSTPLLPSRACKATESRETVDRQMDVIDLSESENDTSPEHVRKARELRLFIHSIKDDLY